MYNFQDFLLEKELAQANFNLFKQVALTLEENEILEWLEVDDFHSLNEESIADKLKNKLESAKETLKEKGRSALSAVQTKVIAIGGKIKGIITNIIQQAKAWIADFIKNQMAIAKSFVAKYRTEINEKVKKIQDKKKLAVESNHVRKMTKTFFSWVASGFFKNIETAGLKVATSDVNEAVQLFESNKDVIPYSHKILSLIHKVPPFNVLHVIESKASKFSSIALSRASYKISKLTQAIEPMEFEVIPALIGLIIGYKIEHLAKDGIISLVPGIGTIVSIISMACIAVSIAEAIEIINDEYDNE